MARQLNGILGSIQGGISFIYGYRRYTKTIISHKPDWSKVFPSEQVQNHRDRFFLMTSFGKFIFSETLQIAVIDPPGGLSNWNWFCKNAFQYFDSNNLLVPNSLQMSLGGLDTAVISEVQWSAGGNFLIVFWTPPKNPFNPSNYNRTNVVCYNVRLNAFVQSIDSAYRSTGFLRVDVPIVWQSHDVIISYMYFTETIGGLDASNTANRVLDL